MFHISNIIKFVYRIYREINISARSINRETIKKKKKEKIVRKIEEYRGEKKNRTKQLSIDFFTFYKNTNVFKKSFLTIFLIKK